MTDEQTSAKLSTKGRVTIPGAIREKLSLRPGDRLQFELRVNGSLEARVAGGNSEVPAGRTDGGHE
ncbi:AbrB/MazE/SpoVT family DNA-binding domain-containing protein [Achromobacter anxifer]|uniref:AbrB/MazE/SpoVT family DNA-binding domain-containing protein n=1 Tax=Achromobacter anxifer TaxID=1287737 RepID=UPI0015914D8F